MICKSCQKEFININGLKFCPYCGVKIEEAIDLEFMQAPNEINEGGGKSVVGTDIKEKNYQNTLKIATITDEDRKQYNKGKVGGHLRKPFGYKKVMLLIITLLVVIVVGVFGYIFFIPKPVGEARIREDLIGKVITFPKGTSMEIKESYMKTFSIYSRNTDKNKGLDAIKVALTLNNGVIEAKTLLSLVYTYKGKSKWEISDKIVLEGVTSLKPVIGMNDKQFWDEFKKLSITIADVPKALNGVDVKNLKINLRTSDLENGKEEIIVGASIDSGLLAASGKIKCKLIFANESWSIATIEKNSSKDFTLVLSPTFSEKSIIETIKAEGLDEVVTDSNLFGGKGFDVKDHFTKSINISDKKYDVHKGTLVITAKRSNIAGEIKTILSTNYTFSISFNKLTFLNKSKTIVDSVTTNNLTSSLIMSTIENNEIEGSNLLFWWSNNHRITTEEAKTYKTDEILAKKGFQNIKYVYGSIINMDGKKNKRISFVALYFLIYDDTNGYNWKLDKIIGADSPNYKTYSKESMNQ